MMVPAVTTGLQALVDPPKWLAQRAGMDGVGHAADVPRAASTWARPGTAKQPAQGLDKRLYLCYDGSVVVVMAWSVQGGNRIWLSRCRT